MTLDGRRLKDVILPATSHRFAVERNVHDASELDTLFEQALALQLTEAAAVEMMRWYVQSGTHTVAYYTEMLRECCAVRRPVGRAPELVEDLDRLGREAPC